MSTEAQVQTQAKTPAAPAAARIPQSPMAELEREADRPDITAQLDNAARLGHRLGAVGVNLSAPPIIQRQEISGEEEEELQMKREPTAVQRQELPEEGEEELMMKPEEGRVGPRVARYPPTLKPPSAAPASAGSPWRGPCRSR